MEKRPYDLPEMLRRIEEAVQPFPKAAMFELAQLGFGTIFQQLVGCIVSIRTMDEVSLPVSLGLLRRAPSPKEMAGLTVEEIDGLIRSATFHEAKARQILAIAEATEQRFGGELPADFEVLTSFSGVGPKCANLAMGVSTGNAGISVDIHVHRVTNRWGLIDEATPEKSMAALEAVVPKEFWVTLNRLLVPFGKHICTGKLPKCSKCPVLEYCQQVGVLQHR
jgi:endonuclease-3